MNRLKEIRINHNLMQQDICNILNILQPAYARYENNKYSMSIENYIKLANYYNTSIDYLVGLTDEKKPYPKKEKN